jgi:cytidyltransferase-like protein
MDGVIKNNVITSGYFIWFHVGHLELLKKASDLGKLTVLLNNDEQQILKYGKIIVPYSERAKILESICYVDKVVPSIDSDRTVCKSLAKYQPEIFAKGGDRFEGEIPETETCKKFNIKIVDGLGNKIQSSSSLMKCINN